MDPLAVAIICFGVLGLLVGLLGSLLPVLPGPPISALGSLILQIGLSVDGGASGVGWGLCIFSILLGVLMTIADFISPGIVAKLGGSGKKSGRYALMGVIIALVLTCTGGGPIASVTAGLAAIPAVFIGVALVLLGAFLGGWAGELEDIPSEDPDRTSRAIKAGFAHMVGLGVSTVAKVGYGLLALCLAVVQLYPASSSGPSVRDFSSLSLISHSLYSEYRL